MQPHVAIGRSAALRDLFEGLVRGTFWEVHNEAYCPLWRHCRGACVSGRDAARVVRSGWVKQRYARGVLLRDGQIVFGHACCGGVCPQWLLLFAGDMRE